MGHKRPHQENRGQNFKVAAKATDVSSENDAGGMDTNADVVQVCQ